MSKNVIHNFNISIKNSTDIKSSEHLTENFIKELAKVSNEMHQQKDIVQIWKEQQIQNAANANNPSAVTKGGTTYSTAETSEKNAISVLDTSLVLEKKNPNVLTGITTLTTNAPIGGGVADTTGRITTSSPTSVNITPPIFGVDNNTLNFSSGLTTQTYAGVVSQQTLMVPKNIQMNSNEPSIEIVKAEIKKRLDVATATNNSVEIEYWRNISKAFEEGAIAQDFDGKPNDMLFTQMYAKLKQLNSFTIESQSFNWDIIRKKMIESIDTNILNGKISTESSIRWKNIRQQINNDTINVANLFEQYDELFLLLKEVEGLDALPISFTIITKTKIYPNLSADKYPAIGTEDVYVFLKQISKKDVDGSKVNNGAVKIKNSSATSFIVGESLEFFLDETFLKQKDEKENINWVVYKDAKKQGTDFINEGTSFTYNFDTAGTYKVEAYGVEAGANKKSTINKSGFVKLNIIAQEIQIKAPVNVGTFTRPFVEEKSFKVSLKNTLVKTLNPVKLYYQIDTINANNTIKISDEQELDALGIIKLAMPDLGTYKIRVASKDQYALIKEFKTSVIKNEVTGIGLAEKTSNDNVFLLGNQDSKITLEAKTFKINPTDEEKEDVKWIIYDSNYKPYLTPETVLFTNKKDPQKAYIHKRNSFTMPIPQKEGRYTVEAFSDRQKGAKAESVFKMEVKQPEITEACWTWSGGSKKMTSGFSGESNWIKAHIPYYGDQIVRIYFYLNTTKTNHFLDVKTNENGAIFQEIKFDSDFKKLIGFKDKKNAKIGFKLLGIQNSKPYPFKASTNYESDTVLSVTIDKKILDVYFTYDGNRVQQQDEVPFGKKGAVVTIVAKTQNMVGEDIVLTAHKIGEKPTFSNTARVSTEGVATTRFLLMNLNKKLKKGASVKYYAGVEGYSTKHLDNKVLVMIVGEGNIKNKIEIIDEDDPQLIWGSKVSKEFRVKVVQICKKLWPDNILEMANGLMAVMNRETGGTFAPHQIEGKSLMPKEQLTIKSFEKRLSNGTVISRAVGLIQFTQKPLTDMGDYTGGGLNKLNKVKLRYANMTQLEQLEKVQKYMSIVAKLPRIPEDIYMAVFSPAYLGEDLNKTIYKIGTTDYDSNASLDVDEKKNGIQIKELITEYYNSFHNGEYARNIWHNPLDKMELRGWYSTWRPEDSNHGIVPTRNAGKHDGLDLYAPVGTPVFACVDGIRVRVGPNPSSTYGNTITIKGFYNGKEYYFFYAHLNEAFIKIGDKVKAGKKIGLTGKTGNAKKLLTKQTHLHFEVRNSSASQGASVNPLRAISELENSVNVNPDKENQK